jgi:hypothetical protein
VGIKEFALRRFPLRTLLLMVLAVIVFVRLYFVTHSQPPKEAGQGTAPRPAMEVEVAPSPSRVTGSPSSPACGLLSRTLEAVARSPEDGSTVAEAQRQLEACSKPPERACELGPALAVRAPLAAGDSPVRGILKTLCQQCPAEGNTCVDGVNRSLMEAATGHAREPAEAIWNLENAGPSKPVACAALVRLALVPAGITGARFDPALVPLMNALTPRCAGTGQVPRSVLSAAVTQQGAPAQPLVGLVTAAAPASSPVVPEQFMGAEAGRNAFDGDEKSGVDLGNGQTPRWEADGALRGQFEPPLKQLTALRVRAKGPGTLRAIVRMPPGLGMDDQERGTFFVNPTVCQFKGTGQWETCTLPVPLLDVEALSVFPAKPKISLHEVEARGVR